MRLLLLVAFLLFPALLFAQFNSFKLGSYILADNQQVRHDAKLKLQDAKLLIAKDEKGSTIKITPREISSFRIGIKRYRKANGFEESKAFTEDAADEVFVELLDSGQVMLMRYEYTTKSGPSASPNGAIASGGNFVHETYLLKWSNGTVVSAVPAGGITGSNKMFREMILLYLSSRPDLIKLVEDKQIILSDLKRLIHALNTGTPYVPEPVHNIRD
ncbi:hypothetical protein FY528_15370 [Hymenobacter lutimineralis]|uniref:Uncharacterized protein n=1 Tax=Hymenobacter lutimineralis TaxID=2606448 RepID=A0A5D6UWI3_9BACT|nr:hypothetical protein [Hymenobacter lutimineralis]TYZ07440.1 hypothetical protein FY528_15370 [Hymenobacter lutimineralis]